MTFIRKGKDPDAIDDTDAIFAGQFQKTIYMSDILDVTACAQIVQVGHQIMVLDL